MPSKMEAPESAKTITVYVNGDQNFGGKKFIVNRRRTPTFDTLLGDVSRQNFDFGPRGHFHLDTEQRKTKQEPRLTVFPF